jgi:hypothetical protein
MWRLAEASPPRQELPLLVLCRAVVWLQLCLRLT